MTRSRRLTILLREIRECRHCEAHLPLGPRPVLSASSTARLLIMGQAPGTRVHESGIPWNDPSGDRLREWIQVDEETFYDEAVIGIVPMGFCYPGRGPSGDKPPRPECSELWHPRLLPMMSKIKLTLLLGAYAQEYMLGERRKPTLTETVRACEEYLPAFVALPHPSPRNAIWLKKNPWFEKHCLPVLRQRVRAALDR